MAPGFIFISLLCFSSAFFGSESLTPTFPHHIMQPKATSRLAKEQLYEIKYFTQTLDHFNFLPESYQTFQQRYLINDSYWGGAKKKAPIFVYLGNEGEIGWLAQHNGFMFDNAARFQALLVFIEHRYYGESIPLGRMEVVYRNATLLGYLSSSQALADYATLIIHLKKNLTAEDSPVVVFGGSYGGMLAAWLRLKYPHVAIGALASSAPILNFEDITSPYSYNNIITNDFKSESEHCYETIKGSWEQIRKTAQQPGGLEKLRKSFNICKNYISGDAIEGWLHSSFQYAAVIDYPTPSYFPDPMPAYPVRQMCRAIDNPAVGNDTFAGLYGAMNAFYNTTGNVPCFDLADDSDPHILGGWPWQACTEMILAINANDDKSIFPPSQYNYSERAAGCKAALGIPPRPHWITTEFGGHDIKTVLRRFGSNIIFFNGLRDPWSGGGVLHTISKSIVAIVALQGAHHVDLRFATDEDPKWLVDVREREIKIITHWLKEYYKDIWHSLM